MIKTGDRVTVAGLEGVHTVLSLAEALSPPHTFAQIRLGQTNGRKLAGETEAVEAWRCHAVPVDLEELPA